MKSKVWIVLLCAAFLCSNCTPKHSDPAQARIDSLLKTMTIQQKIGQLNQLNAKCMSREQLIEKVQRGEAGCIMNVSDSLAYVLQQEALRYTGIPLLIARDMIHGYHTLFPIPLGQACSWDTAMVREAARLSARETRRHGIGWTFSPMVDVVRDPRWGRVAESYGEDTYLTSVMGEQVVRGYQMEGLAATAKHYVGYGAAEGGRDYNTTWIPEVQLRNTYLLPFYRLIKCGCEAVMASFNEVQGVPLSANKHLLHDILRDEWKFDGVIDSDYGAIEQLVKHGVAADKKEATRLAMRAGVDMDMESHAYKKYLKELIDEGAIREADVDSAVKRVLQMKERVGLPLQPSVEEDYSAEATELASRLAAESAVLLKNNGLLPLSKQSGKVLVTGPLADSESDQVGCWSPDYEAGHGITPLQAMQQRGRVVYSPGLRYSRDRNTRIIRDAVKAAYQADVIAYFAGEEQLLSGEAQSLADIRLREGQRQLLHALHETGKPIVLVIMAGRPLTIEDEMAYADAVVYAYHGGTMAGEGIARVLYGETNPCGKLTMTIPRHVGQVPIYYNHTNTGRPARQEPDIEAIPVGTKAHPAGAFSFYLDYGTKPLFPFGYGLSYTTYEYGSPVVSDTVLGEKPITITCTITNSGKYDGYEIAQLYVRDLIGEQTRPVRELKGFRKVYIPAGESRDVCFCLSRKDLYYWHEEYRKGVANYYNGVEDGDIEVWVAPNSVSGRSMKIKIRADRE